MKKEPSVFQIHEMAKKILPIYVKLPEKITHREGREGGYLTIKNSETDEIEAIFKIGNINNGKHAKYLEFSQEKANRLFNRNQGDYYETNSYQSRCEEKNQYGGAVFVKHLSKYILSFSGLPEMGDEAYMLALLAAINDKPRTSAKDIDAYVFGPRSVSTGRNLSKILMGKVLRSIKK
ncbi:MAG: hypothetical protein US50_C0005G0022 [Candidatus Nomurabacteria bacterium GW2011_GWB1_37_5]|uniref:Uncharacterized protein n=1 Tax=Candidatus Nomurabacteria bacterium GW2011_GWB1_37_5 TaxID=1618742 RepID=A0A0G0K571_9BACT|nr:MAG: hypothetical protein US50_C0005G0022 [Candidatus Nomurabacteria bacterium GW2011_GWB1_37_5]